MKINTALYKVSSLVIFGLVISAGTLAYTKAEGNQITVCVKKSGFVYVIGQEFKRDECNKNDSLLSWNTTGIQGPKGDTGETGPVGPQGVKGDTGIAGQQGAIGSVGPQGLKGDKGDSVMHGAGNIAFCESYSRACQIVLKTDGTIWEFTGIWIPSPNFPQSVPVAVSQIVSWDRFSFLDINGDVWRWESGLTPNRWINQGHPN